MATLLEALRGQLNSVVPTPTGGGEASVQLAELMRAKSGLALPSTSTTPRMSSLGEASAASVARGQAQQTQQAGGLAAEAAAQTATNQATEAAGQKAELDEARARSQQQYADRTAELIQEFKQAGTSLDLERDKAKVEQLGFTARLSSEKYVDELERAGAEARLETELGFKDALTREVFGAERDLLEERLGMADILNMDSNQFREKMAAIDLDTALSIAATEKETANRAATYGAIGTGISAGTQAYGNYKKGEFDQKYQDSKLDSYATWKKKEELKAP